MNSPFQQNPENSNVSEGQLLPIKITQKDLLDDSQSSHTEPCEDEIPSEILPERPRLGKIQERFSREHHRPSNHPMIWKPTGKIFGQSPEEQLKNIKENQIKFDNSIQATWKNFLNQSANSPQNLRQEKDFEQRSFYYANISTQDLHLMLQQNIVKISEQSQLCVQLSEELMKRIS